MRVKILVPTEYEPVASDARSCFGQLATKASQVEVVTTADDGTEKRQTVVGPMIHYFAKGRTPELRDEVAADFIARGVAEPFDGAPVVELSRDEILKMAGR